MYGCLYIPATVCKDILPSYPGPSTIFFFSIYILFLFAVLKPHGDGGVATYAGLTSWKHIVTNLHMGGRRLILTPLSRPNGQGRISVESPVSEQPYSGRVLLTQYIGKVLEKVR